MKAALVLSVFGTSTVFTDGSEVSAASVNGLRSLNNSCNHGDVVNSSVFSSVDHSNNWRCEFIHQAVTNHINKQLHERYL